MTQYCQADLLAKKILRAYVPGSRYTGKLQLFVDACYGSKRSDVASESGGLTNYALNVKIANVSMTHSFSRSSVLYTDSAGEYWLLQVSGMESATIQWWVPCPSLRDQFPASSVLSEAYRIHTLRPAAIPENADGVALSSAGTQAGIGTPIAYGWHATKTGNIGHVVLIDYETVEGEGAYPYARSRLCKFQLGDTGAAWNQAEQTWSEYIASRFSITFSVEETSNLWRNSGRKKVWVPDVDTGDMLRVLIFLGSPVAVSGAPVYCRYTTDDELKVRRYTYATGPTKPQKNMNYYSCGLTDCDDYTVYPGASFVKEGFYYDTSDASLANIESGRLSSVRAHQFTGLYEATSGCDGWYGGYFGVCTWELADFSAWEELCGLSTVCYDGGYHWVRNHLGKYEYMDSGNTVAPALDQLMIIPWFNHEGDHDHMLYQEFHTVGTQSSYKNDTRYAAETACKTGACSQWDCASIPNPENRCSLGSMYCAENDFGSGCNSPPYRCWDDSVGIDRPPWPCDSYSAYGCQERSTMSGRAFDTLLDTTGETHNPNASGSGHLFRRSITTYSRHDSGTERQSLSLAQGTIDFWVDCDTGFVGAQTEIDTGAPYEDNMAEFYGDAALDGDHQAPRIEDQESYNYGDRNGWVTGNRSVTLHYGYDSYVEDACFSGAV